MIDQNEKSKEKKSENKHSKLPSTLSAVYPDGSVDVYDANGESICRARDIDTADLIVQSVNSFEPLVEVCQNLLMACKSDKSEVTLKIAIAIKEIEQALAAAGRAV